MIPLAAFLPWFPCSRIVNVEFTERDVAEIFIPLVFVFNEGCFTVGLRLGFGGLHVAEQRRMSGIQPLGLLSMLLGFVSLAASRGLPCFSVFAICCCRSPSPKLVL